jgi:hypothetical protein
MNKRYLSLASMMTLCFLLLLISGCSSSDNKEGDGPIAAVSETACVTCHSTSVERLTGYPIVANYTASVHNLNSIGCQECHGPGASHQGKGPIPYPSPNQDQCKRCHDSQKLVTAYTSSKHLGAATEDGEAECNRCHTHQGAVLSAITHYTGDGNVIAAMVGAPGTIPNAEPIKCNTCHDTHKPQELRVDTAWKPSTTVGSAAASANDQYRLCTQCHGYITPEGKLMGSGTASSGTALVGHHETSWYRIISTTHYDDPATQNIEGYVLRMKGPNAADPCMDCHGHEANAGTRNGRTTTPTIYTDWAQSGHAGRILKVKYAAADANPQQGTRGTALYTATGLKQVDAVTKAGALANIPANAGKEITPFTVDGEFEFWSQDGEFDCQRCHTSTGLVNYLSDVKNYKGEHGLNDFSHLAGWQRTRPTTPPNSSMQQEVLYCWGCHSNPGAGTLRTPGAITPESLPDAWYTFNNVQVTFPDASGSNICVACHSGYRNRDGMVRDPRPDGSANTRSTSFRPHYSIAASTVFNEKAHSLYEFDINGNGNFAEHYTNVSYFAHDKIGLAARPGTGSNGPCVECHMPSGSSHTFLAVKKNASGVITAITNQTLCNSCHDASHGLMTATSVEEEKAGCTQATAVLKAYLSNSITNYRGVNYSTLTQTQWRAKTNGVYNYPEPDYGAFQNSMYTTYEKAAYVHNRIYVQRLIFDSIDWLDNGAFSGKITINATTYPNAAKWFGAPSGTVGNYVISRP